MQAQKGSVRREVAEQKILPNRHVFLPSLENGFEKALIEKFGTLSSSAHLASSSNKPCAFMKIPYDIEVYDIGFGFPKESQFIHLFNYYLSKNLENGNIRRSIDNWTKRILSSKNIDLESMGFENVVSAFYMIFCQAQANP